MAVASQLELGSHSYAMVRRTWFSSVSQSCPTLCDPMDCSTPGFPVFHPSPSPGVCSDSCPLNRRCHPIISSSAVPCPPVFNLSQYQSLF